MFPSICNYINRRLLPNTVELYLHIYIMWSLTQRLEPNRKKIILEQESLKMKRTGTETEPLFFFK